ncbi:MAG: thiol-disulfide oxidoreductase DCC family protein [Bacteroidota bacterium]
MTIDLHTISNRKPLLLFDGVCNLCNNSVQFVIERDPNGKVNFASLQSETGQKVLEYSGMSKTDLTTVVLVDNGKIYTKSSAALRTAGYLDSPFRLMKLFLIVPKFIRDFFYNYIARNRYKWFGKQESCIMPTPDIKARFLD